MLKCLRMMDEMELRAGLFVNDKWNASFRLIYRGEGDFLR